MIAEVNSVVLNPQQSGGIVHWMNDVEGKTQTIIDSIPAMDDETLLSIHEQANALGRCAWKIQMAAVDEMLSRSTKIENGYKDTEEVGRVAIARNLAKQIGVKPKQILEDAGIYATFMKPSLSAQTRLDSNGSLDHLTEKDFFRAAYYSEDPHATLEYFARQKADNSNFTTRDAWRYVKEQKTPPIDSTVPPLIEDEHVRTWYEGFVAVLERAPEMAGLKRLLSNVADEIRSYVQRPTTTRRNQILDLIREGVDELDQIAHDLGTDRIHVAVWLNRLCEDETLVAFEKEQRDGARGQRRTGYRIVASGEK